MNRTNTRSPQRSRPPHPSAFCEYLNLRAQSDCLAEMAITARKQSVKTSVKPSGLLDTAAKERHLHDIAETEARLNATRSTLNGLQEQHSQLLKKHSQLQVEFEKLQDVAVEVGWNYCPDKSSDFRYIPKMNPNMIETDARIGPYTVQAQLGQGHFTVVQSAVFADQEPGVSSASTRPDSTIERTPTSEFNASSRITSGATVAIKSIDKRRVPCIADIMQVEAEVRALSILSQKGSNPLDDSTCVSVGKANVIKIYELTSDVVAVLVRDATAGILYLQRHGLCHRDIKPENLLVSMSRHDINLKVCDFRLCAFVEQELAHAQTNKLLDNAATEAGVEDEDKEDILQYAALSHREPILLSDFAGSPGFFAPEILLQRSYNGYSADLWSLGCVALELLARPSFFNHAWLGVYKVLHTAQAPEFQQQLRQAVVAAVEEVRIVHGTGSSATLTNKTEAVSLMSALLDFNISSRPTATEALKHPWLARADRFHAVATLNKCANAGTAAVRVPGVHSTTNSATILPTNLQMHASNSLTEFGKNSFSAKIESITGRQYQDEKQSLCRGSTMPFRMCPAVISPISSSEGSPFGSAAVSAEPTPLNTPRDNFSHSPCTSRPASAEKRSLNLTFAASTLSPTNRSALYNAADRTANQRFTNSNTCEELSQDIRSDAILDIEETPLGHEDGTFSGGVTAPLVPPAPSTLCQQHPAELQIFFQADSTRSNHTVGHACEIKARRKGRRQSTVANGAAYRAPESSASFPIQPTDLPFSTPSISQESGKSNEFSAPGTVPVYNLGIDELARLLEQRMGQFEPAAQPVTAPTSSAGPGVLTQLRPSLMLGTPLSEDEDEEEGVSNDGLVSPLISILPADPCLARMENCIEDSILNINTSLNTCSMQDPVLHKYPPKLLDSTKDPLQTRAILPQAQSHVHFKMAADDEPEKSAVREPHALHFQHDPSQVGHCANVMHEATKSAAQFPLVQTLQPSTSLTLPMPYVLQSKRRRDSITLLAMKSKKSAWSKAHADGTKTLCKRVVLDRFRDKRSFPQMQVLLQEAGVDERGRNLASRANTAISTANIHPSISPPHPAASTRLPHNPYLFTVPHNEIHTHSASITKGGSRKLFV